jgi:Helix-turn-helix domain
MQVGEALREARLNRGLDLYEVQRVTKIRVQELRAMEEDRWDSVPAAEEQLSAYAGFLELDEEALVEEYRQRGERRRREAPVSPGVISRGSSEPRIHWHPRAILAVAAFAAVVGVIIGLVAIGPLGGSSNGGGDGQGGAEATGASSAAQTTTTVGAPVSVTFNTKKLVWVCLVDQRGRPVIDGQNLLADQTVGPYEGKGFDVTFGNGSVDMTVNGQPVDVPPIAAPLGFRITPGGATRLPGPDQPSCT